VTSRVLRCITVGILKTMGEVAIVVVVESGVGTALTLRARREERMKLMKCMLGF